MPALRDASERPDSPSELVVLPVELPVVGNGELLALLLALHVDRGDAVGVLALHLVEPFPTALLGLHPFDPSAPLDDLLVLIAADAKDGVGREPIERAERVGALGDDVAGVDQDVPAWVVRDLV